MSRRETEWQTKVKGILKGELKRRNLTYRQLADRLADLGLEDSERNIATKIGRGGFSAVFFVQCLVAIGATQVDLSD